MGERRVIELSLRPYNGRLFLAITADEYEKCHTKIFNGPDVISCNLAGRFAGGEGKDGLWTYLVWGAGPAHVAHEFSHVILCIFERCGIDPASGNGEPFCYMLSQLMIDWGEAMSKSKKKQKGKKPKKEMNPQVTGKKKKR